MAFFYKESAQNIPAVFPEAARYSGFTKPSEIDCKSREQIENCILKMHKLLVPQAVYDVFDLKLSENHVISFGNTSLQSASLSANLKDCSRIILLAGTIGSGVDQLIRRAQTSGSADAAFMQATGAMFIESFIDRLNDKLKTEMSSKGLSCRPRFSPGYGDVPLEFQKDFFSLLPCSKIGLSLMDSLIMAPEKSVTAFIGLY